jgi:TolB-like protein
VGAIRIPLFEPAQARGIAVVGSALHGARVACDSAFVAIFPWSRRLLTLIGLASVVWVGQPAIAQTIGKRLAVLEFKGKIEGDVLDAFTDAVRGGAVEGLAGREVDVLTRENIMVLLREMGKQDCTEGDCDVETARNIGADFVVSGTVARIEDALVVTLKLHETKRGSLLATNQIDAKTQLDVLRQLRESGRNLAANNIGPRPAPLLAQSQPTAAAEPRTPAQPVWSPVAEAAAGVITAVGVWASHQLVRKLGINDPPIVTGRLASPVPVQLGRISVAASGPGRVTMNGQYKGVLPIEIADLYPGAYNIRAELQDGTIDEQQVEVVAGRVTRIQIETSPSIAAAIARKGAHFGFEVGAGFGYAHAFGHGNKGPQFSAAGFLNLGFSATVDFRVGIRAAYGSLGTLNSVVLLGIPASFRFNLGSTYSIVLGAYVGNRWTNAATGTADPERGLFLGPELSLLSLRFGKKRDFELAAIQGMAFSLSTTERHVDENGAKSAMSIFYNTFVFSTLW